MTRSLAFFTDLALRRAEGAIVQSRDDITVIQSPQNPTFWWGNFLLMPRPPAAGDIQRWEEAFTAALPHAVHRAFGVNTADGQRGEVDDFLSAGYHLHLDTVLTTEQVVPPHRLHRDATLRPLATAADWGAAVTFRLAVNAADPDGHEESGYREFVQRKLEAYQRMQAAGRGAYFGAFDETGELRSALGIFDAGDGVARYQSVETHPEARSRGLAGTLVYTAALWAKEHLGTRTLVIVADPDYHAQALYERVGFRPSEVQFSLQRSPAQ